MIYTVIANNDIDTIKKEMLEKAQEVGFGVLKEYNFKELLKEKGCPIERDITVFEICNPIAAQTALSDHPEISVYLPCRISLYEKDGEVVLSTIGIEEMLNNFDLDSNLKVHMNTIFDKLKKLIHSWE